MAKTKDLTQQIIIAVVVGLLFTAINYSQTPGEQLVKQENFADNFIQLDGTKTTEYYVNPVNIEVNDYDVKFFGIVKKGKDYSISFLEIKCFKYKYRRIRVLYAIGELKTAKNYKERFKSINPKSPVADAYRIICGEVFKNLV